MLGAEERRLRRMDNTPQGLRPRFQPVGLPGRRVGPTPSPSCRLYELEAGGRSNRLPAFGGKAIRRRRTSAADDALMVDQGTE